MDVQIRDYEQYCSKPDIRIRNYYFQWAADGLGLATNEVNHFKNFVRRVIPVLAQYMVFLQKEEKENNSLHRNDPYRGKKQICIKDRYNHKISFLMFIDSQGSTIFFREESCNIDIESKSQNGYEIYSVDRSKIESKDNSSKNDRYGKVMINLEWLLGELLFDRTN